MNKSKELIKNTIIIFVGKISTQFITFLLIPLYTIYISTSDYGYVDLMQSYITLLVPIILLRTDSAIFRFLIDERKNDDNKSDVIKMCFTIILIQEIIVVLLMTILCLVFNIKYGFAIIINIIAISLSSVLLQMNRGLGDNIGYSIASILTALITIIFSALFIIVLKMGGISILIVSSIANIICSIFIISRSKFIKLLKKGKNKKDKMKSMLKYSIPMIPDGLSWWVINASDRTIISILINSAANGIYAISSKYSNILAAFFQVFNMSWQESASVHINDTDREHFFNSVFANSFKIFFSICMMIMVLLPILFKYIIGKEYSTAILYIPILLIGNLFNAMANVIGGIYIAKKNTKSVARTTIFGATLNIIINFILINKIGLWAAALSTLLSYFALFLYRYFDVQKYIKIRMNIKETFIYSVVLISSIAIYYINNTVSIIINILYISFICIIINYKNIKRIIGEKIKKKEKYEI